MSEKVCDGRVCIVTGAGRGLGREYALLLARHGAKVVVNDIGASLDGNGIDDRPAQSVVDEICEQGGVAVANYDDVASWDGASAIVSQAIEAFGGLDVLVNNAGIIRDRMLATMSEPEWDDVIRIHLKGAFATARHAVAYWRERSKKGLENDARIINTTSASGLYANIGQSNYGSAKSGIATLTLIVAQEVVAYGVTVNAVSPGALTRLTEGLEMSEERRSTFGAERVAPLVSWLASTKSADVTGEIFECSGRVLAIAEPWRRGPSTEDVPTTVDGMDRVLRQLLSGRPPRTMMADVATSSEVIERNSRTR
jgi:NAD(P)-dependent dehydrogenase (short-subunit alcohol dehydrogenase family)